MALSWHPVAVAQITLRGLQFLFAILSAALHGVDLGHWTSINAKAHPNWIYAEVVAVLAAISCVAQWWLHLPRSGAAVWDFVICLLWLVSVAVFGQILSKNTVVETDFSEGVVKAAVAIDTFNMVFWLASMVQACICCGRQKKEKKENNEIKAMEEVLVPGFKPAVVNESEQPPLYVKE